MRFRGKFEFLSNMYSYPVTVHGIEYKCAEAAFQAQKSLDVDVQKKFAEMDGFTARREGKRLSPIREDWNTYRLDAMRDVLDAKFAEPYLSEKLRNVDDYIVEDNTWGDRFWGVCDGKGANHLGKILMDVRDKLQAQYDGFDSKRSEKLSYLDNDSDNHVIGDITNVRSGVIIQQVNCMGVMGAGLAKQIRQKWPVVGEKYHELCDAYEPDELFGKVLPVICDRDKDGSVRLVVANSFSQVYYGAHQKQTDEDVLIDNIRRTVGVMRERYPDLPIFVPDHIGCGLGGGDWSRVYDGIKDLPITIVSPVREYIKDISYDRIPEVRQEKIKDVSVGNVDEVSVDKVKAIPDVITETKHEKFSVVSKHEIDEFLGSNDSNDDEFDVSLEF